jgi:hypothetical protein
MACETEAGNVAASLPACAICVTAETPLTAAMCAAALWNYYNRCVALNDCLKANGIASIDAHVEGIQAEAQYVQSVAEEHGQTVQV